LPLRSAIKLAVECERMVVLPARTWGMIGQGDAEIALCEI
jgi:hypothetical protein